MRHTFLLLSFLLFTPLPLLSHAEHNWGRLNAKAELSGAAIAPKEAYYDASEPSRCPLSGTPYRIRLRADRERASNMVPKVPYFIGGTENLCSRHRFAQEEKTGEGSACSLPQGKGEIRGICRHCGCKMRISKEDLDKVCTYCKCYQKMKECLLKTN